MKSILAKAGRENGLAVLKLSGVPRSGAWQEAAYRHLARLVHPTKWHSHGDHLVRLATRAFQAVQSSWDMQSGRPSTFVPDETDHNAVAAQREAAFAQQMDTVDTEEGRYAMLSLSQERSLCCWPSARRSTTATPVGVLRSIASQSVSSISSVLSGRLKRCPGLQGCSERYAACPHCYHQSWPRPPLIELRRDRLTTSKTASGGWVGL